MFVVNCYITVDNTRGKRLGSSHFEQVLKIFVLATIIQNRLSSVTIPFFPWPQSIRFLSQVTIQLMLSSGFNLCSYLWARLSSAVLSIFWFLDSLHLAST